MSEAFDLPAFIAFCRGKGEEEYPLWHSQRCALAQFGFPGATPGRIESMGIPLDVYRAAVPHITGESTFSALASRLSALIREGGNV